MELFIVLTIAGVSVFAGWVIGELMDSKRDEINEKEEQIKKDNKINCVIAEISVMIIEMIEKQLVKEEDTLDVARIIINHNYKDIDIDNVETLVKLIESRINNVNELYKDKV